MIERTDVLYYNATRTSQNPNAVILPKIIRPSYLRSVSKTASEVILRLTKGVQVKFEDMWI